MVDLINLSQWYWLADDGRVFSAERAIVVTDEDALYLAFLAEGHIPAGWPRDVSGNQTDLSLQVALAPFGLGILILKYAEQKLNQRMEAGFLIGADFVPTDDFNSELLLRARMAVVVDPLWTTPWVDGNGDIVTLDQTIIMAVSSAMLDFYRDCIQAFVDVKLAINAGTITTTAQVDAAFAAVV
jgi:hypothetical protein